MELIGSKLGALIGLAGILNIVKNLSYPVTYIILGSSDILYAFATLKMVAEPHEIEPGLALNKENRSMRQHIKYIFVCVHKTCKENRNLIAGFLIVPFIFGPIVIYEIFINSWINSFYDPVNGPITEKSTVLYLYQYQAITGSLIATFVSPFWGKLADSLSPKVYLPCAFLLRAALYLMTFLYADPTSYTFYIFVPMLHISDGLYILIQSYLQKMFPDEIRGVLTSFKGIFSPLGILFFSSMANYSFQNFGPNYIYVLVSISDTIIFVLCIIFALAGFIEDPHVTFNKTSISPLEETWETREKLNTNRSKASSIARGARKRLSLVEQL